MVNIGPHLGSIDPLGERRRLEKASSGKGAQSTSSAGKNSAPEQSDSLSARSPVSKEDIERYVGILKNMDPADLHRVEDLRQSIEEGNYSSDLNELINPLLDFLTDTPNDSTPA